MNRYPIWSANGERIAFQSDREGDAGIFWQRADGTGPAERLTKAEPGISHVPDSWSPDGQTLSFTVVKGNESSIWIYSLSEKKATVFAEAAGKRAERSMFAPHGLWLAYQANESSSNLQREIFVQPFPANGTKYQVSKGDDSFSPMWSPDEKDLFYSTRGGFFSTHVATKPTFTFGNPISTPLPARGGGNGPRNYDITPDGKQFLAVVNPLQAEQTSGAPQIQVVLNWFRELQERVPVK
jgi:Tol biopolymer transport system component